uniref:DDE-1 domain-containing protein n=1 Tax=Glossina pallidipes TaxID=7398 RepID=A0A1A9ZTZ2_GLOPL
MDALKDHNGRRFHDARIEYSDVKVVFLTPNMTSLIQPLDQGIIDATAWDDGIVNYATDFADGQEEPDYMPDRIYAGPHLCHKLECYFLAIDGNSARTSILQREL